MAEAGRMKFLIWAWDYGTDSGGGIALHRLAHNLATLGHLACLTCRRTAPDWRGIPLGHRPSTHVANPSEVVIYPEIVESNPARGERVVRWLLNTPGAFGPGNGDGVYSQNDLIMYWDKKFLPSGERIEIPDAEDVTKTRWVTAYPWQIGGQLTAWRDLAHFRDYHRPRAGGCYLVRKGHKRPLNQHSWVDSFCIDNYGELGGDSYLIDVFNRVESFTCYDDNTLISTLAHLCGVPRIWIANGGKYLTRQEVAEQTALSLVQTREFVEACERQWPQ
jgi:hypothetical protein